MKDIIMSYCLAPGSEIAVFFFHFFSFSKCSTISVVRENLNLFLSILLL